MFESLKARLRYDKLEEVIYDDALKGRYAASGICGDKLKGKCAVVTGAAGGIGSAVVCRLMNEGAQVIMIDVSSECLDEAVSGMMVPGGIPPETYALDLSSLDGLEHFVQDILEKKSVDIWVNCAGVMSYKDKHCQPETDRNLWEKVMAVNLESVKIMSTAVARHLVKQGRKGTLINIGSILGRSRKFGHTVYALSKSGIIKFGKELADIYAENLTVVTISPGTCVTRMGEGEFGGDISRWSGNNKRLILPEEIAALVSFCAAEHKYLVSGQEIFATGGETL